MGGDGAVDQGAGGDLQRLELARRGVGLERADGPLGTGRHRVGEDVGGRALVDLDRLLAGGQDLDLGDLEGRLLGGRLAPSATLAGSLGGFAVRLVLVSVLRLVFAKTDAVDAVTFALAYVASFLLFVGLQVWAVSRVLRTTGSPREGSE